MRNKKIILAGGSGFIGQALAGYFGKENEIVILSRQTGDHDSNRYGKSVLHTGTNARFVKWNGRDLEDNWVREFGGADIVINLAGKSVNCRYHKKQKKEIFDSRTFSTAAIGEAIRSAARPPSVWINASSATIYRHTTETPNDEYTGIISDLKKDNMPYNLIDHLRFKKKKLFALLLHGKNSSQYRELDLDFSVQVCKRWEHAFFEQQVSHTRKVALRTAITLGKGGVIVPYLNLCKLGMGGKHGNGKQMYSWVHVEDVARMITWLCDNEKAEGVYNCVAPNVISNYSFMKTLRQVTRSRIGLPAYSWMLEAGSFLIGTESELMLKSRWVLPSRALREGFTFKYPILKPALIQIIKEYKNEP